MGYAQEMPPEVKAFLDNYTTDSTAPMGPLYAKSKGYFDDSTPIKDLKWRAIQVYNLKDISIDEYPDTVALSEIIEPIPFWHVFIMAYGKPLYKLRLITNKDGPPKIFNDRLPLTNPRVEFRDSVWVPLLKAYPASTGINPVFVEVPFAMFGYKISSRMGYGGKNMDQVFYFKQKGPRKIYYIGSDGGSEKNDTVGKTLFTASLETLDDSKNLVKRWKNMLKMNQRSENERIRLEKSNGVSKGDSAGWRGYEPMKIKGETMKELRNVDVCWKRGQAVR